jgi:hypothetical protein
MTGGAGTGTAAEAGNIEPVFTDDFHNPPAFHGVENVAYTMLVNHLDRTHRPVRVRSSKRSVFRTRLSQLSDFV